MSYDQVSDILQQQDATLNASEAHGIASGMLCANPQCDAATWLDELLENLTLTEEAKTLLMTLFEQTRKLLNPEEEDFSFDLFLPDSDENDDTSQHAEALRSWCQGFLLGIGYQKKGQDWPGESGEILRDIVEFTKLESDIQDEEDEQALMEIHEYLRAAVLLLRDQLNESRQQQSPQA
jgi:yecA family protein